MVSVAVDFNKRVGTIKPMHGKTWYAYRTSMTGVEQGKFAPIVERLSCPFLFWSTLDTLIYP